MYPPKCFVVFQGLPFIGTLYMHNEKKYLAKYSISIYLQLNIDTWWILVVYLFCYILTNVFY